MKTFGWNRPVRDPKGEVIGSNPSPVKVRTLEGLPHNYGPDKNKRLILTMHPGDLIGIRPERTGREVSISAVDVYSYVLRIQANRNHLEKARITKDKKASRLAALRQIRAEKRLTKPLTTKEL